MFNLFKNKDLKVGKIYLEPSSFKYKRNILIEDSGNKKEVKEFVKENMLRTKNSIVYVGINNDAYELAKNRLKKDGFKIFKADFSEHIPYCFTHIPRTLIEKDIFWPMMEIYIHKIFYKNTNDDYYVHLCRNEIRDVIKQLFDDNYFKLTSENDYVNLYKYFMTNVYGSKCKKYFGNIEPENVEQVTNFTNILLNILRDYNSCKCKFTLDNINKLYNSKKFALFIIFKREKFLWNSIIEEIFFNQLMDFLYFKKCKDINIILDDFENYKYLQEEIFVSYDNYFSIIVNKADESCKKYLKDMYFEPELLIKYTNINRSANVVIEKLSDVKSL